MRCVFYVWEIFVNLVHIQKRFDNATEKEHQNWMKLKALLFSEYKESIVQGMNLLENLDEQVYYDGICMFMDDDGNGNWKLKEGLGCENDLVLKVEILRMAEENIGHEIKEAFENGCLEEMFVTVCGEIELGDLSEGLKKTLLSKMSEMVEVKREEYRYLIMRYQVTQALWVNVLGESPSHFRGASRPVEKASWLDCVILANKLSEKEGLDRVYAIPEGMEEGCQKQTGKREKSIEDYVQEVKEIEGADGYRLPTEAEWEYAAKGGEVFKYAGSDDLDEVGWYSDNSGEVTHPVGQKTCNGYGLYDMSGNVWEWCFDTSDLPHLICRGSCWSGSSFVSTVSYRNREFPSYRSRSIGVRLFRSIYE
jgi:formylglycine-generating enzyme